MVWGAFTNAASAMVGMSWDLGTIGQNISNMNTTGYKTKDTEFQTQLSESLGAPASSVNSGTSTNIFGLGWKDRTNITQQGTILGTSEWTNVAINGRGFFMVAPPSASNGAPTTFNTNEPGSVLYTRAGNFTQTADSTSGKSYLVDNRGDFVLGWMADATGTIQQTLTPVYTLPTTTMPGSATTKVTLSANIPAGVTADPSTVTQSQSVTDSNGAAQTMTLTWTRAAAPATPDTWSVTATGVTGTDTASDTHTVTTDALGNVTAIDGVAATAASQANFTLTGAGPASPVTVPVTMQSGVPKINLNSVSLQVYDSTGVSHSVSLGFEKTAANTWTVWSLTGETGATVTSTPTQVTFDGAGQLISPTSLTVANTWADPATTTAPASTQTTSVAVDISGLTQYSGTAIDQHNLTQDGYASGTLVGTGFNSQGILVGKFDNSQQRNLFQLPVATFVSENSLNPLSGTVFERTQGAGAITVGSVDGAPSYGTIEGASVENSTVDVTTEFTKMILAQKAYTSNTQVFKVADEMTTTVRDLKT